MARGAYAPPQPAFPALDPARPRPERPAVRKGERSAALRLRLTGRSANGKVGVCGRLVWDVMRCDVCRWRASSSTTYEPCGEVAQERRAWVLSGAEMLISAVVEVRRA